MDLIEKLCSKCKKLLSLDKFYKSKRNKDKLRHWCKECDKKSANDWNKENPGKGKERTAKYRVKYLEKCKIACKQWIAKHPEKKKEYDARYRANHLEKKRERDKKYYAKNCERIYQNVRKWQINNPEKDKINRRKAEQKRMSTLKGKLCFAMKDGIRKSLHGNKNGRHWEDLVDYNCEDLKKRLNKTMPKDYTWQDYIKGKLHIDHKIPISAFNFNRVDDLDFKRCWALSNLQLLTAKENLIKGGRINKPFQPSLILGA